ncbi:glycine--tRNA ligase [Candidatus Kapabacteria bacterium]|nr:glycine--tRNA ligase [Candidatus Kapabacteria bacterium]
MDDIISLSKRKGFVFQSSEIYTGLNGAWDYGPLGVELLNNLKKKWWNQMTYRDNVVGIDSSILMHPKVWDASGHTKQFSDPMIDNKTTKKRFRADVLLEDHIQKLYKKGKIQESELLTEKLAKVESNDEYYNLIIEYGIKDEGSDEWTEVKNFNLMFKSYLGATEDSSSVVYLRPETAQGIFVNFKNVMESARQKIPFGIAQIGKAFRNEINTKNFLFRTREFEQMEMQYFVKPGEHLTEFDNWQTERWDFWTSLGIKPENLRLKNHDKLAHYADRAVDVEFNFPFGWGEIEGIHSRTNFDLNAHQNESGKKLEYVDTVNKDRFVPYVVETSAGASRGFMAVLCNAYDEEEITNDKGKTESRKVLRFTNELAPVKAAIFPLVNKDGMPEFATKIHKDLQRTFKTEYDTSGAIGRRYRRQDEVGTPYCITVDGDSLNDNTVTIRNRDTMAQERISADKLKIYLLDKINS